MARTLPTLTGGNPLSAFFYALQRKRRAARLRFRRDNILLDVTAAEENLRHWRGEVDAIDCELARLGELRA